MIGPERLSLPLYYPHGDTYAGPASNLGVRTVSRMAQPTLRSAELRWRYIKFTTAVSLWHLPLRVDHGGSEAPSTPTSVGT